MAQTRKAPHSSRSKRKKTGVKRTVKANTDELLVATRHASTPEEPARKARPSLTGNGSFYVERADAVAAKPPIKQTQSWRILGYSAQLWLRNWWACCLLFILPSLAAAVGVAVVGDLDAKNITGQDGVGFFIVMISLLWSLLNVPASYYLQTAVARGEQPNLAVSYRGGYRNFWRLAGLLFITSGLAVGGLFLLIVPGLIVIRRYILAPYYLLNSASIDSKPLTIRQAMAQSAADSKASAKGIWGVLALYITASILLFLLLGTVLKPYGTFISNTLISLGVFALALRYREVGMRSPAAEVVDADDPEA